MWPDNQGFVRFVTKPKLLQFYDISFGKMHFYTMFGYELFEERKRERGEDKESQRANELKRMVFPRKTSKLVIITHNFCFVHSQCRWLLLLLALQSAKNVILLIYIWQICLQLQGRTMWQRTFLLVASCSPHLSIFTSFCFAINSKPTETNKT